VRKSQKSPLIGTSKPAGAWSDPNLEEPSMGGVINSTAQDVADKRRQEEEETRNKTILSHDGAAPTKGKDIEPPLVETPPEPAPEVAPPTVMDLQVTSNEPKTTNTLADIEVGVGAHQQSGQASATDSMLPPVPPPPLPDFSNLPPLPPTVPTPLETTRDTSTSPIPPPQTQPAQANTPDQFKIPGQ